MSDKKLKYKVSLRDVKIQSRIGILEWEKENNFKQTLVVDVDLYHAGLVSFKNATIDDCINYATPFTYITEEWTKRSHTDLLETLGEELVDFCLQDEKVIACRVIIKKPDVFQGRATPFIELYKEK